MNIETNNGAPDGWTAKEKWIRDGKYFAVEVFHSFSEFAAKMGREVGFNDDGGHRWHVYAYIYPNHPHFAAFDSDSLDQDAAMALPFHRYPSYVSRPFYNGKQTCVKVGSDYNHLHDERYTKMSTASEATSVFRDADELFVKLMNMLAEPVAPVEEPDGDGDQS